MVHIPKSPVFCRIAATRVVASVRNVFGSSMMIAILLSSWRRSSGRKPLMISLILSPVQTTPVNFTLEIPGKRVKWGLGNYRGFAIRDSLSEKHFAGRPIKKRRHVIKTKKELAALWREREREGSIFRLPFVRSSLDARCLSVIEPRGGHTPH